MTEGSSSWFAAADEAALADFWRVYDGHYDRINERALVAALEDPQFGPIVRAMSPAELAAQQADGRDRMRRAIGGAWSEYEANLRREGVVYAMMGIEYGAWHRLIRVVASELVPVLVADLVALPERLARAILVMQAFFDRAMSVIGESYLETKDAALRESEERFARLSASGIVGIVVGETTGAVVEANDAFLQMIGHAREDLGSGRLRMEALTPIEWAEVARRANEQLASDGMARAWEQEYVTKDGARVPVLVGATMLEAPKYMAVVLDISERKKLEEMRARSLQLEVENRRIQEANRLKSEFLANMSHELRTPLNAIIGFSELLHDGEVRPETPEYKEFLGDILASGRHLLQLINDVLDLSKVEAGKLEFHPEAVEVQRTVSEVVAILRTTAAEKRIRVETDVDAGLEGVVIDPARFKQVLYNYISNALKFTPAGGRVVIRGRPEHAGAFRLEVEDTGIGIAAADIPSLFTEFKQLDSGAAKKHGGTGLGLALTKRLVEAQGGSVGVTSSEGCGSTFHAIFPRQAKRKTPWPPIRSFAPAGGHGATVLVVEDDPDDQEAIVATLTQAGYTVETAATGAQALAKCRERRFDAITLDLLLPDKSGLEVLAAIRAETENGGVPVIVVTVVTERGAVAGFAIHDILPKPLDGEVLLASLRRAGLAAGGVVLVVDDDASSLKLMAATLAQLGFRGHGVARGEEGLRLCAESPPVGVVLDLMMPEMDGFEFLDRLRRLPSCRKTPVIIWTVKDLTPEEEARLLSAADGFLQKGRDLGSAMLDELTNFLPAPRAHLEGK
jgi:PAS domain S-box-containing protein